MTDTRASTDWIFGESEGGIRGREGKEERKGEEGKEERERRGRESPRMSP